MAELPRLGPRVWWVYLAVDTPKTIDQLAADAGISPNSIRKHLGRLTRRGLIRRTEEPGAEPMWVQAREIDPATRYRIVGQVERGNLRQPADAVRAENVREGRPPYPRLRWWQRWRRWIGGAS